MSRVTETGVVAFDSFGVGAVVRVGSGELAGRVRGCLPPVAHERGARSGDTEFAIDVDAGVGYLVAGPDGGEPFRSGELDGAIDRLRTELLEHVAVHAPEHLFVRAGAVTMGGRAIVLPAGPGQGKSALVTALVRDGATYYADGYAPIDSSGHVHPYRLHPIATEENAKVARAPAPVAVIATLAHREGAALALRDGSPDDGILALLHHALGADLRPEFALGAARAAAERALVLEGERDGAEQAAAALIERLARLPSQGPSPRPELPLAIQFVTMVLELEAELTELAGTLEEAGVEAVLVNGDEVRPALAHGFAFSFSAVLELPRSKVPRALGAMESAGWQRMPEGEARYFRRGVVVRIRPRPPRLPRAGGRGRGPLAEGRFGFAEPEAKVAERQPEGSLGPMPFDPGGESRTGSIGAALQVAAEAWTVLDTLRLRTREREFHGVRVQDGPGVHSFETVTESLVDAVLARLPKGAGVRIVEVGTGTGAVALSIARERPDAEVLATDVSLRALGWARRNRRRLGLENVRFAWGSLLAPVPPAWRGGVTAIAVNPPMALPSSGIELRGIRGWPLGTATGPGADGLGLVRVLARDARDVLAPGGHLHLHLLARQASWIAKYLDELGYEVELPPDPSKPEYTVEIPARWPGSAPT